MVLAAKLTVPQTRPETVARARITELLATATAERRLTVVCAPAGYGKTTALVEWLTRTETRQAWVSLHERDNDARRLCAYLLAAIDRALPDAMADAQRALAGGSDLIDTVLASAVNGLVQYSDERLVLVLDDYHRIEHPDSHALVSALLDTAPASLAVILSSRTPPPLRLARRRTLGTIAELGSSDLVFRGDESHRLLNEQLDLALDGESVETIEAWVQGWPAGLALVASSLAERSDRDKYVQRLGERHTDLTGTAVAEYLIDEVLDRTEPRLREFLYRTSILTRLCGPLCAAVLEDQAAHELLAEVRRSNLFVTSLGTDRHGEWLRYHHLFAELLERELRANSPELVADLHSRACEWFAANGLAEEAIAHATAAGDGPRAAALLFESWRELVVQRRWVSLHRIIAQLPPDRGEFAAFFELLDVATLGFEGTDLRLVAERLDALESQRGAPGVEPLIDVMRVYPYYGDIGRAVRDGWSAWERCPHSDALTAQLGMVLWFGGHGDRAHDILEPALSVMEDPTARSWTLATLAFLAVDDDDPELAEHYARQGVHAAESHGGRDQIDSQYAFTSLAEALRVRGALEEAGEHLAHAVRITSKRPASVYHAFTLVFDAQLALTGRDRSRAQASARRARRIVDRYPDTGVLADRLAAVEATLDRRTADTLPGTTPTKAELRVLALLPSELNIAQIADRLYVSHETVRSHIQRLYRRLGAHTRQEALLTARQRGLL